MRSPLWLLTLAIAFVAVLPSGTSAAGRQAMLAVSDARISLHTLDGDTQQVDVDEIWRIRLASGSDEPAGAIVVDYAFERVYVKDSLDDLVSSIRSQRKIERFTSPSGAPVYILPGKVIGIARPIATQHHPNTKAIIIAREGQQQVQESRDAVREALGK
jgi:hypothetical protein